MIVVVVVVLYWSWAVYCIHFTCLNLQWLPASHQAPTTIYCQTNTRATHGNND